MNISKTDFEELEKPDTILLRKLLSLSGNPSKVFIQLEMGVIPVKFVIMQKRMNFLHYILNQDITSMIRQVYIALKEDSRKGDFVTLTNNDRNDLNIDKTDFEIQDMTKPNWKKYIKEKVLCAAFQSMITENKNKEKTCDIKFESLKMSKYLDENKRRSLSKLIFSVRSKTLDIKDWCPWKYVDVNCVACGKFPELWTTSQLVKHTEMNHYKTGMT